MRRVKTILNMSELCQTENQGSGRKADMRREETIRNMSDLCEKLRIQEGGLTWKAQA